MTRKEIIDGLKFTVDMILFDPLTGEVLSDKDLNEDNLYTLNACREAIKALNNISNESVVYKNDILDAIDSFPKFACLPNTKLQPFNNLLNPNDYTAYVKFEDIYGCVKNTKTILEV